MAHTAERIEPREARRKVEAGEALLVCAYDSREKFDQNHLEGAIPLQEFESQVDTIPKDREIFFYCA
jgi:rhodanese-related sulfurtransferase